MDNKKKTKTQEKIKIQMSSKAKLIMFAQKHKLRVQINVFRASSSLLDHLPFWNGFLYVQHPNLPRTFQVTVSLCTGKKKDIEELLSREFVLKYNLDEISKLVSATKQCVPWDSLTHEYMILENVIPHGFFSRGKYLFLDLEGFDMKKMTCEMVCIGNGGENVVLMNPSDISNEMFNGKLVIMFDSKLDKKILANYGIIIEKVLDLQEIANKIIGGDHWSLKTLLGFFHKRSFCNLPDLNESDWWHNTTLKTYACADIVALMKCFDFLRYKKTTSTAL